MLLLITHWDRVTDEVEILRQIAKFDSTTIHVRKPGYTVESMKKWLAQFSEATTRKMVLHEHHQLAEHFPINGIHYKESNKKYVNRSLWNPGLTISAAYHDLTQAQHQTEFDYCLLSPVFDSISKEDLKGRNYQVPSSRRPVVALGGITANNIGFASQLGYQGVGVLGSVWCNTNPLKAFKTIEKTYEIEYA